METLDKNKVQDSLDKAQEELLELEIKKGKENISEEELKDIEDRIKEIKEEYPELDI